MLSKAVCKRCRAVPETQYTQYGRLSVSSPVSGHQKEPIASMIVIYKVRSRGIMFGWKMNRKKCVVELRKLLENLGASSGLRIQGAGPVFAATVLVIQLGC